MFCNIWNSHAAIKLAPTYLTFPPSLFDPGNPDLKRKHARLLLRWWIVLWNIYFTDKGPIGESPPQLWPQLLAIPLEQQR